MKFPPLPLFYDQPMKKLDFFHYPRVSTGALPLTKKPVDSGYESEAESVYQKGEAWVLSVWPKGSQLNKGVLDALSTIELKISAYFDP